MCLMWFIPVHSAELLRPLMDARRLTGPLGHSRRGTVCGRSTTPSVGALLRERALTNDQIGDLGCTPARAAAAAPARPPDRSTATDSVRKSLARTAPKHPVRVPARVFLFPSAHVLLALGNPSPAFAAGGVSGSLGASPDAGAGIPG
jgi:hypothetical protein